MNNIITYFIEANLCLLIFGALYYLVLQKETDFKFRRFYLLVSSALVLIIPFLHFSNPFSDENYLNWYSYIPAEILGSPSSSGASVNTEAFSFFTFPVISSLFYIAVALIFLTLFLYQIFQVFQLKNLKKDQIRKKAGYELIYTNGQWPSFSFFNLLFFDNSVPYSEEEKQKVIAHEEVHIKQWHSLDIVLIEVLKAIFWINPVIWWLRADIQKVHEYLADRKVLNNSDELSYSALLAKMTLRQMSLSVGLHFNKSFTLKRIKMMKTPKSRVKSWKLKTVIMAVGLTVLAFSCDDQVMNDVTEVMETATQKDIPANLTEELAELKEKYPDADFIYMETDGANEDAISRLKNIDVQSIAHVNVDKQEDKIGLIVNQNGPLKKASAMNQQGEVFQIVDDPGIPLNGYDQFYADLMSRMEYPEQARRLGVEGTVYVQFVVDMDGSLTEVEVVRGIGAGCDEKARAAIASSEKWKPARQKGKEVKQRIVLPVKFILDKSSTPTIENNN